jgi:hypothetical protein
MTELTLEPGILRVASAFPDPPFEVTIDGRETGFDVELTWLICEKAYEEGGVIPGVRASRAW